ncbi:MAG: alpha-glucan family phosphorylase [Candidatus Pacebacteria bacterium]|nr:alpha-glucan family phosphorylase [Candidatus Paceibacterota bacterium]
MTKKEPQLVAYFCAEYGLESRLPIYAGGLGVLSGDTLKAAADKKVPVIGVGLLYHGEAAKQIITPDGEQIEIDVPFDELSIGLEHVYVDDKPLFIKVHLTEVDIWVRVWKKTIGETVTLYLLDTDTEQNQISERTITYALYHGTEEELVKQQMILGIGGVKLLYELGLHPCVYHINEGRPAFLHWQLIRMFMDKHGMSYAEAKKLAKEKTVYTNHTLVAAGNKGYPTRLIETYADYYAKRIGISLEELLADGTYSHPDQFKMTRFALNISSRANGVSALHTKLSEEAWRGYDWRNITNGVHMPTWQSSEFRQDDLTDSRIWEIHTRNKQSLVKFSEQRCGYGFDPNKLVVGWARRIADYKHLDWFFEDMVRLEKIVKDADRPVQLIIAGKAHFGDTSGKALLKKVIGYMQNELSGSALFLANYDLDVANHMVKGCDVWVNTPEFGKEACGTSGMKAIANGVLNLTVEDGWVGEANWDNMGWLIDHENPSQDLYSKLESEIVGTYYDRNDQGLPIKWISMMRKSIETAKEFSAQRMFDQYYDLLYCRSK